MSKQLALATHKLLASIFRQVRRWEQAILPSTYYTGRVHSILGQNLNGARRRRFGQFFRPYLGIFPLGIFGFFAENRESQQPLF